MSSEGSSTKPTPDAIARAGRAAAAVHAGAFALCIAGGVGAAWASAANLPQPAGPTRPVTVAIIGFIGVLATIGVLRHLWVRPLLWTVWRRLEARHGRDALAAVVPGDTPAERWFARLRDVAGSSQNAATAGGPGRHEPGADANETEGP